MPSVPLVPDTAPFSPEQRAWLNGFFAGIFSRAASAETPAARASSPPSPALRPLTILFGSQTGTAEGLAKKAAKEAGQRGFAATVLDMAQADLLKLSALEHLLVITSTYGDGEPPDNGRTLHAALKAAAAAEPAAPLKNLRFSICALGDSNYTRFCQCGKDFDLYFEQLGAQRASARTDCDVDYDAPFAAWLDSALSAFSRDSASPATNVEAAHSSAKVSETFPSSLEPDSAAAFSRAHPFPAPVLSVRRLTAPTSAKEVNHIELSLADSGLTYEAGDALGVFPQNCPDLVADVLTFLGCDGEEAVADPSGQSVSLRRALTEFYDLGKPTDDLLALVSPVTANSSQTASSSSARPHHVIDALRRGLTDTNLRSRLDPAAFVKGLRKLQPRLYSISSSPRAHAGQVHLTVGAVRYDLHGLPRKGVCSTFLAERALAAGHVGVFVHRNNAFRLPASPDTPVIMVGPGTGIAPFRSFLAERHALGSRGRHWLFFGDQHVVSDFLYRDELLAYQASGFLHRLDLAWSRDQSAKVYVQHRLLEHARDLFQWLEEGAHFYVCGDASRMARDVDAALREVVATAGGRSREEADAYLASLRASRRYQRDVY